jgi:hypothetical protein
VGSRGGRSSLQVGPTHNRISLLHRCAARKNHRITELDPFFWGTCEESCVKKRYSQMFCAYDLIHWSRFIVVLFRDLGFSFLLSLFFKRVRNPARPFLKFYQPLPPYAWNSLRLPVRIFIKLDVGGFYEELSNCDNFNFNRTNLPDSLLENLRKFLDVSRWIFIREKIISNKPGKLK